MHSRAERDFYNFAKKYNLQTSSEDANTEKQRSGSPQGSRTDALPPKVQISTQSINQFFSELFGQG